MVLGSPLNFLTTALYFQVSIVHNNDEVDNVEVTDTGHGWV